MLLVEPGTTQLTVRVERGGHPLLKAAVIAHRWAGNGPAPATRQDFVKQVVTQGAMVDDRGIASIVTEPGDHLIVLRHDYQEVGVARHYIGEQGAEVRMEASPPRTRR